MIVCSMVLKCFTFLQECCQHSVFRVTVVSLNSTVLTCVSTLSVNVHLYVPHVWERHSCGARTS